MLSVIRGKYLNAKSDTKNDHLEVIRKYGVRMDILLPPV